MKKIIVRYWQHRGDYKRVIDRTRSYVAYYSLYMLIELRLEKRPFELLDLLILLTVILVGYLDAKFMHSKELKSNSEKNPILMAIYKEVCKKERGNNEVD